MYHLILSHSTSLSSKDLCLAWQLAAQREYILCHNDTTHDLSTLLIQLTNHHTPTMTPKQLSIIAWCSATWGGNNFNKSKFYNSIVAIAEPQLLSFSPDEFCALLWACCSHCDARDNRASITLIQGLSTLVVPGGMDLQLFSPRDLSVLANTLTETGSHSPPLITAIDAEASKKWQDFDNIGDIAALIKLFLTFNYRPSDVCYERLMKHSTLLLKELGDEGVDSKNSTSSSSRPDVSLNEIGALCLAIGKVWLHPGQDFFASLIPSTASLLRLTTTMNNSDSSSNSSQQQQQQPATWAIVAILWCLGRFNTPYSRPVVSSSMAYIKDNLNSFKPSELLVILWAFAKLSDSHTDKHGETLFTLTNHLMLTIHQTDSRTAALLLYCVSHLATSESKAAMCHTFAIAATQAMLQSLNITPNELANSIVALSRLNALSKLNVRLPKQTSRKLELLCTKYCSSFTSHHLGQVATATVLLGWNSPALLDALATTALKKCSNVPPRVSMQVLCAFIKHNHSSDAVVEFIECSCLRNLTRYERRDKEIIVAAHASVRESGAVVVALKKKRTGTAIKMR